MWLILKVDGRGGGGGYSASYLCDCGLGWLWWVCFLSLHSHKSIDRLNVAASGFPPAQLLFNCCVALTHCRYVNNDIK